MFDKDTTAAFKTLIGMVHPDKLADQPDDIREAGENLAKALNKAKDSGYSADVRSIMSLIAKYGVTKSNMTRLTDVWDEFSKIADFTKKSSGQKSGPKARPNAEPTINPDIMEQCKDKENATGWDRSKMAAWMNLEFDLKGKAAKVYLDEIFAKAEGNKRGESYIDKYYAWLSAGIRSKSEFDDYIKANFSENGIRWAATHWRTAELSNAIHAKYQG